MLPLNFKTEQVLKASLEIEDFSLYYDITNIRKERVYDCASFVNSLYQQVGLDLTDYTGSQFFILKEMDCIIQEGGVNDVADMLQNSQVGDLLFLSVNDSDYTDYDYAHVALVTNINELRHFASHYLGKEDELLKAPYTQDINDLLTQSEYYNTFALCRPIKEI